MVLPALAGLSAEKKFRSPSWQAGHFLSKGQGNQAGRESMHYLMPLNPKPALSRTAKLSAVLSACGPDDGNFFSQERSYLLGDH